MITVKDVVDTCNKLSSFKDVNFRPNKIHGKDFSVVEGDISYEKLIYDAENIFRALADEKTGIKVNVSGVSISNDRLVIDLGGESIFLITNDWYIEYPFPEKRPVLIYKNYRCGKSEVVAVSVSGTMIDSDNECILDILIEDFNKITNDMKIKSIVDWEYRDYLKFKMKISKFCVFEKYQMELDEID